MGSLPHKIGESHTSPFRYKEESKAVMVYLHCPNCGDILESQWMPTAKTFYIICLACGHNGYSWFCNPTRRDNGL